MANTVLFKHSGDFGTPIYLFFYYQISTSMYYRLQVQHVVGEMSERQELQVPSFLIRRMVWCDIPTTTRYE
jgi:hypothetical protein